MAAFDGNGGVIAFRGSDCPRDLVERHALENFSVKPDDKMGAHPRRALEITPVVDRGGSGIADVVYDDVFTAVSFSPERDSGLIERYFCVIKAFIFSSVMSEGRIPVPMGGCDEVVSPGRSLWEGRVAIGYVVSIPETGGVSGVSGVLCVGACELSVGSTGSSGSKMPEYFTEKTATTSMTNIKANFAKSAQNPFRVFCEVCFTEFSFQNQDRIHCITENTGCQVNITEIALIRPLFGIRQR